MSNWYSEGTISLVNGSKTVTGAGTAWLENVAESNGLDTPNGLKEIESVTSNTVLQLVKPYAGPTINNVAYSIIPTQGVAVSLVKRVVALLSASGVVKDKYAAGELALTIDLNKRATLTQLAAAGGSSLLGYDDGNLQDIADYAKVLQDFTVLRAYAGRAKSVRITAPGIAGTFLLDAGDTTTPDNGGTVIVGPANRRWKRQMMGLSASPLWFGIPLNSTGVDYTAALQALLDTRNFVFPEGFTASCRTLYLRSNSLGDFKNARFKLLPNMPAGTQVMVLGTVANAICENSTFWGGVLDGNRAQNTVGGNNFDMAGGDGGQHGLQVHHARNVRWYGLQTINCNTDGIIVWQRANTLVDDVHIYSPVCDGNARQGLSVIACKSLDVYDGVFANTAGRAPQAGIDLEGNDANDAMTVRFHGLTKCFGNAARGFMTHTPGNKVVVTFDELEIYDNRAADCQFALYISANGGTNVFNAKKVTVRNGKGMYSAQASGVSNLEAITMNCDEVNTDTASDVAGNPFIFGGNTVLNLGVLRATGSTVSADTSILNLGPNVGGRIRYAELVNNGGTSNSFAFLLTGAGTLAIDKLYTRSPRGGVMTGASNKTIPDWTAEGAMQSYVLRMISGSTGNRIVLKMKGALSVDQAVYLNACPGNDIDITWKDATVPPILCVGAGTTGNRIRVNSNRPSASYVVGYAAGADANFLHDSQLANTGGTLVYSESPNNKAYGCWPPSVNSAS